MSNSEALWRLALYLARVQVTLDRLRPAQANVASVEAEPSIPDDLLTEWPVPPERFV